MNGAQTGVGGYGNVKNQVGQSNGDHPAYTPVLYRPNAPKGQRFSREGLPTSKIARMYHSVASLLPSGNVLIAGSNPNLDRTVVDYPTCVLTSDQCRVADESDTANIEWKRSARHIWISRDLPLLASPAICSTASLSRLMSVCLLVPLSRTFQVSICPRRRPPVVLMQAAIVSLIDLGFVTHAIHMNSRLVSLVPRFLSADGRTLRVEGPPSEQIYPPGPGWLYILVNGVPSEGKKVMIGSGAGPPVDEEAIQNLLAHTEAIAYKKTSSAKTGQKQQP